MVTLFAFLGSVVAFLELRNNRAGLVACFLGWELSLRILGAFMSCEVANKSTAIGSSEISWACEFIWGTLFVTTTFKCSVSNTLIVKSTS
jgi:hypothetical protein